MKIAQDFKDLYEQRRPPLSGIGPALKTVYAPTRAMPTCCAGWDCRSDLDLCPDQSGGQQKALSGSS
jgi:hypothetical protein